MFNIDTILTIVGMIGSAFVSALVFSFKTGAVVQQLKFINTTLDKLEARMDRFEARYNYDGQYYTLHPKRDQPPH